MMGPEHGAPRQGGCGGVICANKEFEDCLVDDKLTLLERSSCDGRASFWTVNFHPWVFSTPGKANKKAGKRTRTWKAPRYR